MNNRIIKFRVWDAWQKCWNDPALYTLGTLAIWNHSDNGPIAQQYTGCNDAFGKEIYEGDILEWKGEFIAEVFFLQENAAFVVKSKKGVGGFMSENYMLNFKIIGNIFEHKHLLK